MKKYQGKKSCALIGLLLVLTAVNSSTVVAQGGSYTLYGDVKVDQSKVEGKVPMSINVLLYTLANNVVGRQSVPSGGRYRFPNLRQGDYKLAVEVENSEIARMEVTIGGAPGSDIRQDLEFEWKPMPSGPKPKAVTVSAADVYSRPGDRQTLFNKAQGAVDQKKFADAVTLFKQLLESDPNDFQAWSELGTTYLILEKLGDAEKAYVRATEVRPSFVLALINLGRVRVMQKKFEEAISPLTTAVEASPESADANFYLGEAYLQIKKGSKAVGYLTEAARLGRADAHLRLATLYNAVGMKDKAAVEYEEFLKKKPDHPERKKLEQYITANKKS